MKNFIALVLVIFSLTFSAAAQQNKPPPVSPQNDETLLRVETGNGQSFELKAAGLAKLPRREVKGKTHGGAEAVFSGVELHEVLKAAGVKFGDEGKKSNLVSYLLVEAADNYRVVFAMSELEPGITDKIVLLADTRDGNPLSKEEGKVRLVVPDEKKQARWIRQVVRLRIKKASE